ncbi:drosulfakinins-like [Limulus polyphemus]|uniref:Drosulfakinins-like n=1 Tax=Limulus polyphemus TaxID=6850 RepID=A0ABM1BHW7_LIMPO|nr:drosulfakinins-like [Limulus polyphemus]
MKRTTLLTFSAAIFVLMTSSTASPVGVRSNLQNFARMIMPYLKNHVGGHGKHNWPLANKNLFSEKPQMEIETDGIETMPDVGFTDFEDNELNDMRAIKRQFDDYGHMRFGRSNSMKKYDDYGHMRFGK